MSVIVCLMANDRRSTLNNLEGRLVSGIGLLGFDDLGVKPLADLLRNGSAIDLGGRHCNWSAREGSSLGSRCEGGKGQGGREAGGVVGGCRSTAVQNSTPRFRTVPGSSHTGRG